MHREWDWEQVRAGKDRRLALAEDIRKAELVRDRLLAVEEVAKTYPEGHRMRARLEGLHLEEIVEELDRDLRDLYDRSAHPGGT